MLPDHDPARSAALGARVRAEEPDAEGGPGRARLRGFLQAQSGATHVLLVSGTRVGAAVVAEELGTQAAERGHAFAIIGPATLRSLAEARGWWLALEEDLRKPAALRERLRAELRREPSRPLTLLVAPSTAFANQVVAFDEALGEGDEGIAARYCLLPRSALRDHGAPGALALVQRHRASFALA